jgi:hypothetical protein
MSSVAQPTTFHALLPQELRDGLPGPKLLNGVPA